MKLHEPQSQHSAALEHSATAVAPGWLWGWQWPRTRLSLGGQRVAHRTQPSSGAANGQGHGTGQQGRAGGLWALLRYGERGPQPEEMPEYGHWC